MLTFGHGTASQDEITALLQGAGVGSVVDVRTAPGSRRHPHVSREALAAWLPESGIDYRWERRLGGFRRLEPGSPDVVWRHPSFRAYAGHMRTPEFVAAIDEVLASSSGTTVVMCSESVWWRCHRRLIADFVAVARRAGVRHLMHDGRLAEHRLGEGVRLREDGLLVYDAGPRPSG